MLTCLGQHSTAQHSTAQINKPASSAILLQSVTCAGSRLYKEMPSRSPPNPNLTPSKASRGKDPKGKGTTGKGAKGRGKKAKGNQGGSVVGPPAESAWELVASNAEELQAVGEELVSSSVKGQSDIGYQVSFKTDCQLSSRAAVHVLDWKAESAWELVADNTEELGKGSWY